MNEALLQRLRQSLAQREGSSLRRKLTARAADDTRVNLADNDYLGLSRDPAVIAAGVAALQEWGASAAASPLVTGYTEVHQQLERTLAAWQGWSLAAGLVFGLALSVASTVVLLRALQALQEERGRHHQEPGHAQHLVVGGRGWPSTTCMVSLRPARRRRGIERSLSPTIA